MNYKFSDLELFRGIALRDMPRSLEIYAYVISPSHIHMLCRAIDGHKLSDTIRDLKKFTSKRLIELIKDETESRRDNQSVSLLLK